MTASQLQNYEKIMNLQKDAIEKYGCLCRYAWSEGDFLYCSLKSYMTAK
jgi:hypothetical protein